ncbi:N4BP2-like protein [Mya arenaria]|uniref:N4BP2-like protein n=1 Tax=Mya arenaria TaxID=6604 RepID=A0ABY7EN82_MYAAR|nr:N4BP2-like protein [Mya arenaria]
MIILLLESLWILKEVMTYFGIRRFIDLPDVSSDEDDGLVFVKHGTIETSVILINSDEAGEDVVVISDDVVNTGGQKQKEKDVFIDLSDKDDTDSIKKETTEVFYATRISNTESANINSSIITDGAASNVVTPKDVIIINDDDDNETVGLPSTEPQPSTSNEKELDAAGRVLWSAAFSNFTLHHWDQNKLSDAHQYCQTLATQTCDQKCPVVIIDNTNIQRWTMAHYVKLAQTSHYYHIIIVEPETPWRYDPDILAARNSHGVTKDIIAKKLQSLRDNKCLPYYYGRRAICARVDLYWENDEITAVGQDGGNKANFETASSSKKQNTGGLVKHNNSEVPGEVNQNDKDIDDMLNLFVKPEEEDLRSKYEGQKRGVGYNDRQRLLKHGCSAHVTISYAKTGQARHSGDDVLRIVEMDFNGQNIGTAETSIGKVVGYGGEMCAVTLKRPVTLDSLFQGFYSMRR